VEGVGLGPALALGLALLGTAIVGQQLEGGAPFLALHLPIQHHTRGHHYQVRAPHSPAPPMHRPFTFHPTDMQIQPGHPITKSHKSATNDYTVRLGPVIHIYCIHPYNTVLAILATWQSLNY
jgi:hypothetical protein